MHENPFNPWLDAVDERLGVRMSRVAIPLLMATAVACGIVFFETFIQHRPRQMYLVKNLFLGGLPLAFALLWFRAHAQRLVSGDMEVGWMQRIGEWTLLACWLFFLPNAPYMFTDLIHSFGRSPDRVWTDMIKISLFAVTSLCAGHLSLALVHKAVRDAWGWVAGWGFVVVISALSSVGVWLGRFRRWNTWDLLHRPGGIFGDTLEWAQGFYQNPAGAWFPVLMFLLILFSYLMVHVMRHGQWVHGGRGTTGQVGEDVGGGAIREERPISEGVLARTKRSE